jgi:hypothetical protein
MMLQKELPSNLVLISADLLQNPDTVGSRQSHDCQKAAKTRSQSETGTQQESLGTACLGTAHRFLPTLGHTG